MSAIPVYCPRCGRASPEGLRFCTHCGCNLEAVSRALTGELSLAPDDRLRVEVEIEYAREWSKALANLLTSLVTMAVLWIIFRQWWVLFLLFWVLGAAKDVVHAYLLKKTLSNPAALRAAIESRREEDEHDSEKRRRKRGTTRIEELPPRAEPLSYVSEPPRSAPAHHTGDGGWGVSPPSVTEETTRQLDRREPEARRYAPPQSR